ncbi:MAG TPA: hypothetical protein VFI46_11065 [Jiangellaceae bacterium]|nr:hypothetical protein [Jiangellaceae bacterium]
MDFGDHRFAVEQLVEYIETATGLGFDAVSANDNMVVGVPWLTAPLPWRQLCSVPATRGCSPRWRIRSFPAARSFIGRLSR